MDNNLKDKEVLSIIDVRGIQKYIFKVNNILYIAGADKVMKTIILDALKFAVKNIDVPLNEYEYDFDVKADFEKDEKENNEKKVRLIGNVAGNAHLIFKTGELYEKVVRKISRYFLLHTYCLDIASCCVEKTDDFSNDLDRLYEKLDAVKSNSVSAHPLMPLPIVKIEKESGEAIYTYNEKFGYVSRLVDICLNNAEDDATDILKNLYTAKNQDGTQYVAVVHMDGNNLGMSISKILREARSYEKGITMRQQINSNIQEGVSKHIDRTLDKIKKELFGDSIDDKEFEKYFKMINHGGDDINFSAEPHVALRFIELFFEDVDSIHIYKDEKNEVNLSLCAGIAFVSPDTPVMLAISKANECCSSAKAEAKDEKNLIDGKCGNWIDFDVQKSKMNQNLNIVRERLYNTASDVNLLLRPLSFDIKQKDSLRYYYHTKDLISAIEKIENSDTPVFDENIYMSEMTEQMDHYNDKFKLVDKKIINTLGTPYVYIKGKRTAHWYDAIELRYLAGERND